MPLNNAGIYCVSTLKIMIILPNVCQKLRKDFVRIEAPSAPYVRYLVKEVKETGILILIYKPKGVKPKTVHTPENIAAVAESVCEAPST